MVNDDAGDVIHLLEINGYYFPAIDKRIPNHEEVVQSTSTWKARNDDVMICAYPKSDTHWLWEVTSMLLNGSAEWIQVSKETAMLELVTRETYDNIKYPRVLNSHMYIRMLPEDFVRQRCKTVHVLRNPKDVAVSFYNHHVKLVAYEYNGKWENYIHRFITGQVGFGSWFDYTLDWENVFQDHPGYPIHVVRYEDMKEDSIKETRRLALFLDVKADEELIQSISNACDFDSMKQEKEPTEMAMANIWKDQKPGMYRKGQVGDWKNWFTVAQNELFDAVYVEKMKNSQGSLNISYDIRLE